jgi:hypothetical protein
METKMARGIPPEPGAASNQGAPEVEAVKPAAVPFTKRFCATGAPPGTWQEKESDAGLTTRDGMVTVRVTGMVMGLSGDLAGFRLTESL